MRLAEALAERADLTRTVERLRARVVRNARYQEGETPAEDAGALLAEADRALARLETLVARINATNAATVLADGSTLTDALARRDVLRLRHALWTSAADAASGQEGYARQLRSELKNFPALPVAELRATADAVARDLRRVDLEIQQTNWEAELFEE